MTPPSLPMPPSCLHISTSCLQALTSHSPIPYALLFPTPIQLFLALIYMLFIYPPSNTLFPILNPTPPPATRLGWTVPVASHMCHSYVMFLFDFGLERRSGIWAKSCSRPTLPDSTPCHHLLVYLPPMPGPPCAATQGYSFAAVICEMWVILGRFPSQFPALCQFYDAAVKSLNPDQTKEFAEFVQHQKVSFMQTLYLFH